MSGEDNPVTLSRERERLLRRISTRRGREKEGVVLVEGPRALGVALDAGARFSFVVIQEGDVGSEAEALLARFSGELPPEVPVVRIPAREFRAHSDTDTPQGIAAVVREPRAQLPPSPDSHVGGILILDRIQDPGNAGTLIRAAAAFGLERVVALDGTVDVWNPKVVRASTGLAFRMPLHQVGWDEVAGWLDRTGTALLVADAGGADVRAWLAADAPPARWALAVGNEAGGPRQEVLARAGAVLSIPLAPGVESLNAAMAGTVLLWALGPGRMPAPFHPPASPPSTPESGT